MSATPYYSDDTVELWLGDCRKILPTLGRTFDCAVADPPYGETQWEWDRWPDGWLHTVAQHTASLWCFGSMRTFLGKQSEFADWRLSQDVIGATKDGGPVHAEAVVAWEKPNGSGFNTDRIRRVHEYATHWYHGDWSAVYHQTPHVRHDGPNEGRATKRRSQPGHTGAIAGSGYTDTGTRLLRSVINLPPASRTHRFHPSEKPVELLDLLIRYACPPGGVMLDPFAGSGSTAVAARLSGRRAVLIERHEPYAEAAANRLSQGVLPLEVC